MNRRKFLKAVVGGVSGMAASKLANERHNEMELPQSWTMPKSNLFSNYEVVSPKTFEPLTVEKAEELIRGLEASYKGRDHDLVYTSSRLSNGDPAIEMCFVPIKDRIGFPTYRWTAVQDASVRDNH